MKVDGKGNLDPSFGTGGIVDTAFPQGPSDAYALAVRGNGQIVAAGQVGDDFALAEYDASGHLVPSFGSGGTTTTAFNGLSLSVGNGLAIQWWDNKVVAVGSATSLAGGDFAVARYRPDGGLDPSFGDGGLVRTSFPPVASPYGGTIVPGSVRNSVAIQADGKLVVAGFVDDDPYSNQEATALVRYNRDGSLDTSFGNGGLVISTLGNGASSVAIQWDGKIVVDGPGTSYGSGAEVERFNADGSVDTTFGTGGVVSLPTLTGVGGSRSILVRLDGKLDVVGGVTQYNDPTPSIFDFAVVQLNRDGSLDPHFGSGGVALIHVGDANTVNEQGQSIAERIDGKLVVAGAVTQNDPTTYAQTGEFGLARLNPNGTLDPAFGNGGTVETSFFVNLPANVVYADAKANGVVIQPNGKIVAAGSVTYEVETMVDGDTQQTLQTDFALARYEPNGRLDPSFGTGRLVATAFPNSDDSEANAVVLQLDGKIVAAGTSTTPYTVRPFYSDIALARYQGDPTPWGWLSSGRLGTWANQSSTPRC